MRERPCEILISFIPAMETADTLLLYIRFLILAFLKLMAIWVILLCICAAPCITLLRDRWFNQVLIAGSQDKNCRRLRCKFMWPLDGKFVVTSVEDFDRLFLRGEIRLHIIGVWRAWGLNNLQNKNKIWKQKGRSIPDLHEAHPTLAENMENQANWGFSVWLLK